MSPTNEKRHEAKPVRLAEAVIQITVWVVARAIYFAGTFVFVLAIVLRNHASLATEFWESPGTVLFVPAAIAAVAALVGPGIYTRATQRGRGKLQTVKNQSRRNP